MEQEMSRARRSSSKKPGPGAAKKKKETTEARRRRKRLDVLMSNYELVSTVCELHCGGMRAKQIIEELKKYEHLRRVEVLREDPGYIVEQAGKGGSLVYRPSHDAAYRDKILMGELPAPEDIDVVRSIDVNVVAREASRMLVRMLRNVDKKTVHVGVAGGHTMRALMRALARELVEPIGRIPPTIHFHALAAGFDLNDPTTNPNSFVSFFDRQLIATNIKFTGLNAPAIVDPGMFGKLKDFPDIKEAFDAVKNIDIFATSGTSWLDEHAVLRKRMEAADRRLLEAQRVVGDVLWRPLSLDGPIEIETASRAFTLVELSELQELIRSEGRKVLLALAPCGICRSLKGNLLRSALEARIATHVVCDMRSAGQLLATAQGA